MTLTDPKRNRLAVLCLSTRRPTSAEGFVTQARDFAAAGAWARTNQTTAGTLLIGDFNSTTQGTLTRRLRHDAGLHDTRSGHGWLGTYPSKAPAWARFPIDGALASVGWRSVAFDVSPPLGGDHRAIYVALAD